MIKNSCESKNTGILVKNKRENIFTDNEINKTIKEIVFLKNKKILLHEIYAFTGGLKNERVNNGKNIKSLKIESTNAIKPFIDEPVKMYLNAIGKERLLTATE